MIDVHKSKLVLERGKNVYFQFLSLSKPILSTNISFQFFVHFTVYQEYSTKYWSNYSNFSLDINFTFLSFYQQLETNNFFLNLVLFLVDIPIPRLDRFQKKKKSTHSKERKKAIPSRKNPRFPITLNRSSKLGFSFRRGRITVGIRKFSHVLGHGWNV